MAENLVKQESYFTRREWILRYSKPFKSLMFMAGPMIMIMLVNSLYGIVDKQLVLNFAVGEVKKALEGQTVSNYPPIWSPNIAFSDTSYDDFAKQLINVSTQYSNTIVTIITALSLFTSVGTGIRFGQAMGARDREKMNNVVISGFIQTAILAIISVIVLSFVYPYILTSQARIAFGDRYTSWQFALSDEYSQMFVFGMPLLVFSNFFVTLLRTEGKVWVVIFNNLFCVVLNVIFGIVFMDVLDLGMKGAVFGTMVAWTVSIVVSIIVIATSKDTYLRPNFRRFVFTTWDAAKIWEMGLSPLLTQVVFAVVSYVSTILITNLHADLVQDIHSNVVKAITDNAKFSWDNLIAMGTGNKIPSDIEKNLSQANLDKYIFVFYKDGNKAVLGEQISNTLRISSSANPWMALIYAPVIGMSQGASVNYAYNIGANKRERILKIFKIHLIINIVWLIIAEVLVWGAGKQMMAMFSYTEGQYWWFQIYLLPMIFASLTFTVISLFQGLGNPRNALIVSVSRALLFQVLFIVLGWVAANYSSKDGQNDWLLFMMNGLQEIPAFLLALVMIVVTFKNWRISGQFLDVPDTFEKPSIKSIVRGEYKLTIDRKVKALNDKLNNFKLRNKNEEKIYKYEKKIIFFIKSEEFKNNVLTEIAVSSEGTKEAKLLDKNHYHIGNFENKLSYEGTKLGVKTLEDISTDIKGRISVIENIEGKYYIKKELNSLNKLWKKVGSLKEKLNNNISKILKDFEIKKKYFENNKDKILEKLNNKNKIFEARLELKSKKQDQYRLKYEDYIISKPYIIEKQNKKKLKIEREREREIKTHDHHTNYINNVLQKREERIAKRVENKK